MYTHKIVVLQCLIQSPDQKTIKIKLQRPHDDWNKNLPHILNRIRAKFQFLSKLREDEWAISVHGTVASKTDPGKFGEILSGIPPQPTIDVMRAPATKMAMRKSVSFRVILESEHFLWSPSSGTAEDIDWDTAFDVLYGEIKGHFCCLRDVDDEYIELEGEDERVVGDGDELGRLYDGAESEEIVVRVMVEEMDNVEAATISAKHVAVTMRGRGKKCIQWIPPEPDADEWSDNFQSLIADIEQGFGVQSDHFRIEDGHQNELDGHEGLLTLWDALDDEKESSFRLKVVPSTTDAVTPMDVTNPTASPLDLFSSVTMASNHVESPMTSPLPHPGSKMNVRPKSIHTPSLTPGSMILSETYAADSDAALDLDSSSPTTPNQMKPSPPSRQPQSMSTLDLAMAPHLATLGNGIGLLLHHERDSCGDLVRRYMDWIEEDRGLVQDSLRDIMGDDRFSGKAKELIVQFMELMGYSLRHSPDGGGMVLSGEAKKLKEIKLNFHHFTNAMHNPEENIYQQLDVDIPDEAVVKSHASGIYDDRFITFQLPKMVMEAQQSSLVNKTILDPGHLERFLNFLAPGSSKNHCNDIYFDKLKRLKVRTIGVFGSRQEVLDTLTEFAAISEAMYGALQSEHEETVSLQPGIHGSVAIVSDHGDEYGDE